MFYREFTCENCGKETCQKVKHRYQVKEKRRFCSKSCAAKASAAARREKRIADGWVPPQPRAQRPQPPFYREFVCVWCEKHVKEEVLYHSQIAKKKRFCNRVCQNKWMHANDVLNSKGESNPMHGKRVRDVWLEKHGEEKTNELLEQRRIRQVRATAGEKNGMHGKNHTADSRQKISNFRSGKTLEELWGEERAQEYKEELSNKMRGAGNPMFGKTSSGGRSIKGTYKGYFFRSLLEYSFMRHLEEHGHSLEDIDYETVRIPVNDTMTYKPDFFIPATQTLYEVKAAYAVSLEENLIKFEAARYYCKEKGWTFAVVTEHDFRKIPFAEAQSDANVIFDERTLLYFRRTM